MGGKSKMAHFSEGLRQRLVAEFPDKQGVILKAIEDDNMPPIVRLLVKKFTAEGKASIESLLDEVQEAILK